MSEKQPWVVKDKKLNYLFWPTLTFSSLSLNLSISFGQAFKTESLRLGSHETKEILSEGHKDNKIPHQAINLVNQMFTHYPDG